MKRLLLFIMLIVCLLPLWSRTLSEGVDFLMDMGSFMEHKGENVFMCNYYWGDEFPDEAGAVQFVAQTALVFMMVHEDYDDISNSSLTSQIKNLDNIACPWTNDYQVFILSIPLDEICSQYDLDDLEEMGEMDLFEEVKSYIEYYGDQSPLSFYE